MAEQTLYLLHNHGLAISLGLCYKGSIHFLGTDTPDFLLYSTVEFISVTFFSDQIDSLV